MIKRMRNEYGEVQVILEIESWMLPSPARW